MKNKRVSNLTLIIVFFVGVVLLLYPSLSDYWNSFHQSKAIANYVDDVEELDEEQHQTIWNAASEYNRELKENQISYYLTEEQKENYNSLLNIGGNGIMGYIEIPSINCFLPIYHGTDDVVLQIAIGHLEWTSLPVGGESTHCVISGHRGLPSAKLFTDLDRLIVGDKFMLQVLDEVLTYEIDQIRIVLPDEIEMLKIEEGKDYCTLVTCTPYGINSHRLLIRGHRVENLPNAVKIVSDGVRIDPMIVAPIVSMPVLFVLLMLLLIPKKKKKYE